MGENEILLEAIYAKLSQATMEGQLVAFAPDDAVEFLLYFDKYW